MNNPVPDHMPLLLEEEAGDYIREEIVEEKDDQGRKLKTTIGKFLDADQNANARNLEDSAPIAPLTDGKQQTELILSEQLDRLQKELNLKDIECSKLHGFRDRVSTEVEELAASLFEEATRMVNEEKLARQKAEKALLEANMKLEGLMTEAAYRRDHAASKTNLLPSRSTRLHILESTMQNPEKDDFLSVSSVIQWFRKKDELCDPPKIIPVQSSPDSAGVVRKETDPIVHREFVSWREKPSLSREHALIRRIYEQDILPAFEFGAVELAMKTLLAVENNMICIEEGSKYKPFAKTCSLSLAPRMCFYRMKLNDEDVWYPLSTFARNRVTTVCDFFTYIRYIQQGLVRRGVHDTWWEIVQHRQNISLARLGLL